MITMSGILTKLPGGSWLWEMLTRWDTRAHTTHTQTYLIAALLLFELAFSCLIVWKVPYTEIDWIAYMQEVQGWVDGDTDYTHLRGDTGPLVYPAGFLYVYRGLRWVTGSTGTHVRDPGSDAMRYEIISNIRAAQWVFIAVYVAFVAVVLRLYQRTRPGPPWIMLLLLLSKRIHSLFMLRLFNDCIAMFAVYAAVFLFTSHQWLLGCIVYSLGVSVKMNALLMAPGLLWLLLRNEGIARTMRDLFACAAVQVVLGLPFLMTYPWSYLTRAFELSRVFMYKWTVNLKFLPEEVFVSKTTALVLLGLHLGMLVVLAFARWGSADDGVFGTLSKVVRTAIGVKGTSLRGSRNGNTGSPAPAASAAYRDTPFYIAFVLLSCNFVGIVFSRTLHYQFYVWYFHALPFLLWCTDLHAVIKVGAMFAIEYAFNVGDAEGAATPFSSAALTSAHLLTLAALLFSDWTRDQRQRVKHHAE